MSRCDHLDQGAIAADPAAARADGHVATCDDCRASLDDFDRIAAVMPRLAARYQPRADWEARVRAAVAAPKHERGVLRWAVPAIALAAAVALYVAWRPPSRPAPLRIAVRLAAPSTTVRGSVAVGDAVALTATGGPAFRALWVFRDGTTLVLRCPGDAQCRDADGWHAGFVAAEVARYDVVYLASEHAIPPPQAQEDPSVAAAVDAGAQYTIERVIVR